MHCFLNKDNVEIFCLHVVLMMSVIVPLLKILQYLYSEGPTDYMTYFITGLIANTCKAETKRNGEIF